MAIDSTYGWWATVWGWMGIAAAAWGVAFVALETTAVVQHGWTLSNMLASYTTANRWTLYAYVIAVILFGVHIWVFNGK